MHDRSMAISALNDRIQQMINEADLGVTLFVLVADDGYSEVRTKECVACTQEKLIDVAASFGRMEKEPTHDNTD